MLLKGFIMVLENWYTLIIAPNVDCTKSGIYRWQIDGAGTYIGRYSRITRPTHEYRRNVTRILDEIPSHHRSGKFRRIHHALAVAVKEGRRITLTILENVERPNLNQRERELIRSEEANLNGKS